MATPSVDTLTDADILAEVRKLQYLFGLKREIRYGQSRQVNDTESVAEHVYGLHILALYFLNYEDPEGVLDRAKIFTMVSLHDIDEIETGDIISYYKTASDEATGIQAQKHVVSQTPAIVQSLFSSVIEEFEAQETPEAKFVKAIDKFEPFVHLYNLEGKQLLHTMKTTRPQSIANKEEFVQHFASIKRFFVTLHSAMVDEGYFYTPTDEPVLV